MDARLIRQLWATVQSYPNNKLAQLDDSSLKSSLVELLQADPGFDVQNIPAINSYINQRILLIRELSQQV